MDDQTRVLLAHLHRGGAYAFWWTAEGKASTWWHTEKPAALPTGRRNVYVGVHPVEAVPETNARGEVAESRAVRSQVACVSAINCLFAEYDAKDFADKPACRAAITELDPPPSAIVDSGGGYHCYWLLDKPFRLSTPDARARAVKVQAAWVTLMGGDPASKDLARVLRVPGTKNYKYDPPRSVVLNELNERRYRWAELAKIAAPFVESDRPVVSSGARPTDRYAASALAREIANVVRALDGQKHDQLYRSAASIGELVGAHALDQTEAETALYAAIAGRAKDQKGAMQTVKDGIAKGMQNPRKLPESARAVETPAPRTVEYTVDWHRQGVTLAELQHKQFEPERWVIESILPEGACLLAAKYKSKKSWLGLALGLAVSMGGRALGRLAVSHGRVLYLDLEGKQQRIQKRTRAMLGVSHIDWPNNFHIFTKWPQGDDGMAELERWFASYPDTALVIIDVLASFRRPIDKHEEPYRYDRDTIDPINALCERQHAAGLLVHHFNKGKHEDIMDSITGTTGIPSAVNTMWGLRRDLNDSSITIMELRGRDLENEDPLALRWDSYLNQHVIEGPAVEVSASAERRAILTVLKDDLARTPKEIAIEVAKPVTAIQQLLRKLLNEGAIDKVGYGKYAVIHKPDQSSQSGNTDQSDQSDQSSVDQDTNSDRDLPTLIGSDSTDQSSVRQQDAVKANSDHSDRYIYGPQNNGVPADYVPGTTGASLIESIRKAKKEREKSNEPSA